MAEKVKKASPYFLILVLVGLVIAFNFWTSLDKDIWNQYTEAADVGTSVSIGNSAPTIGHISLGGVDGGSTITLTENTTIAIIASATITDANGCSDVRNGGGVKAIVYMQDDSDAVGKGASCSQDKNDCYDEDIVSCSFASYGATSNICEYECVASIGMWYYTNPTANNGGTASVSGTLTDDEEWIVAIIASDSYWADAVSYSYDRATSNSAEVALLTALDVGAGGSDSIPYGNVNIDDESSAIERGVRNTGNRAMNPGINQDTILTSGGETIVADHQQFNLTTFTTDDGTSLSAGIQVLDTVTPQRTSDVDNDASDDQIFWVLYVPSGTEPGDYKGKNLYTVEAD